MKRLSTLLVWMLLLGQFAVAQNRAPDQTSLADQAEIVVEATLLEFHSGPGVSGPVIRGRPWKTTFLDYGTIKVRQIRKGAAPIPGPIPILIPRTVVRTFALEASPSPGSTPTLLRTLVSSEGESPRCSVGDTSTFYLRRSSGFFSTTSIDETTGELRQNTRYIFETINR